MITKKIIERTIKSKNVTALGIAKEMFPGDCSSYDHILKLKCMLGSHPGRTHKFEDDSIKASWQDGNSGMFRVKNGQENKM